MFTKQQRDIVMILVCIGIGIAFCIGSFTLKDGNILSGVPSAGLFPFIVGLSLIVLSLIHLLEAIKKKDGGEIKFFPQNYSWKKLLLSICSLFFYAFVLDYLGFLFTTFVFMVFVLRYIVSQKWTSVFIISFLSTAFSSLIFQLLLKVALPTGIFLRGLL